MLQGEKYGGDTSTRVLRRTARGGVASWRRRLKLWQRRRRQDGESMVSGPGAAADELEMLMEREPRVESGAKVVERLLLVDRVQGRRIG